MRIYSTPTTKAEFGWALLRIQGLKHLALLAVVAPSLFSILIIFNQNKPDLENPAVLRTKFNVRRPFTKEVSMPPKTETDELVSFFNAPESKKTIESALIRNAGKPPMVTVQKSKRTRAYPKPASNIVPLAVAVGTTQAVLTIRVESPTLTAPEPNVLKKIRSDPRRIFLDEKIKNGELTWGVRNVSPDNGLEVWVENDEDSQKIFYLPRAAFREVAAVFQEKMVAPGQRVYGFIAGSHMDNFKEIELMFSTAGSTARKAKVKLPW